MVLRKGKPLYSGTSHKVENQRKKAEGVRFNSLTVQNISGKRKMGKYREKYHRVRTVRWSIGQRENTPGKGHGLEQGNGAPNKCAEMRNKFELNNGMEFG